MTVEPYPFNKIEVEKVLGEVEKEVKRLEESKINQNLKLLKISKEIEKAKYAYRMKQNEFERETAWYIHQWRLERERISRAERRKDWQNKERLYQTRR
tara:strand:- start:158 stop:451 length:294 start_codon:yes stop_codon:yes gene_type:complete